MGEIYRDIVSGAMHRIGDRDSEVFIVTDAGMPTGATGAGILGKGSLFIDSANGTLYENRGTKASPSWDSLGSVSPTEIEGMRLEAGVTITELNRVMELTAGVVGEADNASTTVIGINKSLGESGDDIVIRDGIVEVYNMDGLTAGDDLKVASYGAVCLHRAALKELAAAAPSAINDVTSPAGDILEVLQLTGNVEAMQGKVIRVVGSNAGGDAIWEDFTLDGTDTETPVIGAETFETVSGAYVLDGTVVDTNDVRVRIESVGATVLDIVAGTDNLGAVEPDDDDPHFSAIDLFASAQDTTFVTLVGTNPNGVFTMDRLQLDDTATNSLAAGTEVFMQLGRICTGELTTAVTVRVDARADTSGTYIGRALEDGTAGNLVKAYIVPNYA